ncbi:MAG: protein phosphatase 2C domain-containing protein [Deltaproteobacteria bacterium]|nr:protein phosphatase 2C domain-containing protein [Myxococcales bacterium]MDP3216489.1 protein phosphatase 2C domain-containing protein [Deltaproteobacteria bacterium]
MDAPSPLAPDALACRNPRCTHHGEPIRSPGPCPHCWVAVEDAPPVPAVDPAPAVDAPPLRSALRVHQPLLSVRLSAAPVRDDALPPALRDHALLTALRFAPDRDHVRATFWEPDAPLRPFDAHLRVLASADERVSAVGRALSFLARLQDRGVAPLTLFPDALWIHPEEPDDLVLLVGPPSEASWPSTAAQFVFSAWAHAAGARCDASGAEDVLHWLPLLLALDPPVPPDAVGLLRDALCEDRPLDQLARAWRELTGRTKEVEAPAATLPFRYGAAQRAGRRKGSDGLLPEEYQQDRWCCRGVPLGADRGVLLALADGVSTADFGSGAGAAERAIAVVRSAPPPGDCDPAGYLRDLVERANEGVREYVREVRGDAQAEDAAPATTLTLCLVEPGGRAHLAWVGDSPALGWDARRATFVPLTAPHHGELVAVVEGVEARAARGREDARRLARFLGMDGCVPSLATWTLPRDGGLILASDGFLEGFGGDSRPGRLARAERKLAAQFAAHGARADHLQVACETLCTASDEGDGRDNLTVVAVWRGALPTRPPERLSSAERVSDRSRSERS